MYFWKNPKWFNKTGRNSLLDDHVLQTNYTRFGNKRLLESDKNQAVMEHFNRVAPHYDFMNSLLSMGIQHTWKRAAVRKLSLSTGDNVLDVCGGTGDLSLLAKKQVGDKGKVVVYDINRLMMSTGRDTSDLSDLRKKLVYIQGDAEHITFKDNYFDVVMVGFGIRNLTHLKAGFKQMHRVLKPGGRILCLEFSRPVNPVFRFIYDFYSFNIMPFLGLLLAGSAESYACLPETIRMFPLPDELKRILEDIGFEKVEYEQMTNGIAVAHIGTKKKL